jgi:hypothetical protein
MGSLVAFLAAVLVCALIWVDGERAARRERIERARRREHAEVPPIYWADQ